MIDDPRGDTGLPPLPPDELTPLPRQSPPGPSDAQPEWLIRDFVWAMLAGLAGALAVGVVVAVVQAFRGGVDALTGDLGVLVVATTIGQYGGHGLALVLLARRRRGGFGALSLRVKPSDGAYILVGVALQLLVALVFSPLSRLVDLGESPQALTELIPDIRGTALRTALIVSIAFVAPLAEEILFRGILYRAFERRWGLGAAMAGSALVFSLFHLAGVTSGDPLRSGILLVPQIFVVGLVLAWLLRRNDRLGVTIFTHAGFNLVAVMALFFAPNLIP